MSDKQSSDGSKIEKPLTGSNIGGIGPADPSIDITSELFDPLKALYSKHTKIPFENAKIYDNIAIYESSVNKTNKRTTDKSKIETDKCGGGGAGGNASRPARASTSVGVIFERRFLPHQVMVQGTGPKARHSRNVIQRIDNNGFDGPLECLTKFMKERRRVKIYTRKEHGILGYITGFIESFDKHWNIALSDVFEVWKRRKTHFCETANFASGTIDDCAARLKQLKITLPVTHVKSLSRRYAECSRHVPQLLIRGEQVAIVTLDENGGSGMEMKDAEVK